MSAAGGKRPTRVQGLWLCGIGLVVTVLGVGAVLLSLHLRVHTGGGIYVFPVLGVVLTVFGLANVIAPGATASRPADEAGSPRAPGPSPPPTER